MTKQELKQKILSLSAKEIIMAMVEGLKNPKTKIDMSTYGTVSQGICYGCAATNAIIHISNCTPEEGCVIYYKVSYDTIKAFELAINELRNCNIENYNFYAEENNFATIKKPDFDLPYLGNDYTLENLEPYIKLAEMQ